MFSSDGAHYIIGVIVVVFVAIFAIWAEAPELLWGRSESEIAARCVSRESRRHAISGCD